MSEFCCIHGHIMPSGAHYCPECGGRVYTMDGKTNKQLEQEDKENYEDEEEDDTQDQDED